MSAACRSAARVSALLVRSGPQPALLRSLLVSCRTCASVPPLGAGGFVDFVGVGVGVVVRVGRGVGFFDGVGEGERVPSRLGAVVDRVGVGVGLGFFDGVLEGVADGVLDGAGVGVGVRAGVLASSCGVTGSVVSRVVSGLSWLVVWVSSRLMYQPAPASRASTVSAPRMGPATPPRCRLRRPCDRGGTGSCCWKGSCGASFMEPASLSSSSVDPRDPQ
jgi:hypothetical protein